MQIIDRTGSMTGADMANAKDGARALLEYFNGDIQRVGLAVLGPAALPGRVPVVRSRCPDYAVVLPVHLSDDYQTSPGVLNEGSRLVSTINCLRRRLTVTNLGDPPWRRR